METKPVPTEQAAIRFNLGTFEGFNFRSQSAIFTALTASDVVHWDHARQGEAEFWPSGDRAEVALVFKGKTSVTGSELLALDRLLRELGGDSAENFLRIHYALNICTETVAELSAAAVEEYIVHLYFGSSFMDLRHEAAFELFGLYYPEEYRLWDKNTCKGLLFDEDLFLDSPRLSVEEVTLGEQKALLVAVD